MKLSAARIGYAGYSRDFSGPGDRRRFVAYARLRGLPFEYADLDQPYDVVLVTHNADIPGWTKRKRREGDRLKIVFELVDSYFERRGLLDRLLKGVGRFALGADSRLSPDFLRTLVNCCKEADAVICSTEEQREIILRYNPNVFLSFDLFEDELSAPKDDAGCSDKLKIVWEGQSTTLPNLQAIREPLNALKEKVELHVVTDPVIHRYFGRFGAYPAIDALKGIECDIAFHPWELESFSDQTKSGDLVVIPIDLSDPMARAKSASKLIMMWKLGMPVLTAATPAYERVMAAAGLNLVCAKPAEWLQKLEHIVAMSSDDLQAIGKRGRDFAERAYSKSEFMRRFDDAFASVGFTI